MERKKRIPKRRFREFLEAGEWEDFSFGSLVERKSTMITGRSLPILEYEDLISGSGELNKDITQKSDNKTGIFFQEGDIVYGKLRPYLKNWYLPTFAGIAVGDFWVFRSQNIAPTFIYGLIQTPKYEAVANKSVGTKMPRADWHVVSDTPFFLPMDYCEQKKIGDFCRRLDTLISLHQQKLTKLKDLKQAYLTEMFPAPGEKRPRRRFKGFSGDWEEYTLGKLCSEFHSGKFIPADKVYDRGQYPVYGGNGLRGYTDSFNHDGEYALIGRQGALCGNMNYSKDKAYFTEHAVAIKANDTADTSFLYYLCGLMDLGQYSGQSAQPGLAVSNIILVAVLVPKRDEQIAIGRFFQHFDEVIFKQENKISKLQSLKQAYLSELFV